MSTQQRPSLEKLLDRLDHVQTQRLLQELVAKRPELIEEIESHVSQVTTAAPSKRRVEPVGRNTVDPTPYRQQVRQILRNALRCWEEGYEDDPIAEELLSLVQSVMDFCERGDGHSALVILEAIASTCVENWEDVADYGADNEEIVQELNQVWCEAILTTELTPDEKVDIQVNLETWQDEWDANFGLALEALHQGWDFPPLVQVLQGDITPRKIWDTQVPDYANDLARIRLKILERQERYQEYLHLAQGEGQTQQYLTMLGQLGRVEEAVDAAQSQMSSMEEAFALAKTLQEQEKLQQALDIAVMGLELPGNCQYDFGTWTSDLAQMLGDKQAALSAKTAAFLTLPSFADYQKIKNLAGENWTSVKTELLERLQTYGGWGIQEAKVDIFLYEGLIDDAIGTVSELSSYHSTIIYRVMDAAIPHNPDWVIANARRRAESIMDAGKAEYYHHAIDWLKKVRAAYLESGRNADWSKYRGELVQTHARKRKLMQLFKQRGME
jgi:uncharacterized Zn finger protein